MKTAPVLVKLQKRVEKSFMNTINKEECVGHVQKRIGRALREYKRKLKGKKLDERGVVTKIQTTK